MERDDFTEEFIEQVESTEPIDVTPSVIHHAAAGLTLLLGRNTTTVEDDAHARGEWRDHAMLRVNTRATAILRDALSELVAAPEGDSAGTSCWTS